MSEQVFCRKCGSQLSQGSAFCSKCGEPVASAVPSRNLRWEGRRHEKQEKMEKHEKHEKNEKNEKRGSDLGGALVGGSILIWLGVTFYLERTGQLASDVWWGYFLMGIGAILMVSGLVRLTQGRRHYLGQLVGGAVLFVIGLTGVEKGLDVFWPLILVFIGAGIIVAGLMGRRKSPTP